MSPCLARSSSSAAAPRAVRLPRSPRSSPPPLAPAAHAAPTTIATEQRATQIAALGRHRRWSTLRRDDERLPPRRLAQRRRAAAPAGRPERRTRSTSTSARTAAGRRTPCTRAARRRRRRTPPPTGCDLYRLSIASGVETKLDTLSSPTWDEREPTIFRGEIAFIRNETHGGRNEDVLRIGNTTSGSQGTTALVMLQPPRAARSRTRSSPRAASPTSSPTARARSATSMCAR